MEISSEEDFNTRIELFFKIYNSWGFRKKIRTFVSPCGMKFATDAMIDDLTKRLGALKVQYLTNYTLHFNDPLRVYNGITLMKKGCSYNKRAAFLNGTFTI